MSEFVINAGAYVQFSPDDCPPDQWGIALASPKDGVVLVCTDKAVFIDKSVDELYPPTEAYLAVIRQWHENDLKTTQWRSLADVWNDPRIPG